MKLSLIIFLGKIISVFSRLFNLGAGGTWPGEVALLLKKDIFRRLTLNIQEKIILVAGTNGKTTTAKIIEEILKAQGFKTLRNQSGGNVLNGLISSLISGANFSGEIKADWIIFEVDEATVPLVLSQITPKIVIFLNLFRDQLDRYGEVDILAERWQKALKLNKSANKPIVILNADDPQIAYLGRSLKTKVFYFGLKDKKFFLEKTPHATDSIYCPSCLEKLSYKGVYMAHLGEWECSKCGLKKPSVDVEERKWENFSLFGVYSLYNALAAILTAKLLGIKEEVIKKVLKNFQPAFGRQEEFNIKGRKIKIFLSKNPTGMNEAIRTVNELRIKNQESRGVILLVLNDRVPDGKDVSWIWDVDTEDLIENFKTVVVSGDRTYDMGLRIKYANKCKVQSAKCKAEIQNSKLIIEENLRKAIYFGIEKTSKGKTFYILPTYSAMLEVRKILTGRKIL